MRTVQPAYRLVTTRQQLVDVIRDAETSPRIAVDTEANSRHRYPERVCLVQLATERGVYVIDAVALPDLSRLGSVLADTRIEKVLHGADYDIRGLSRDWGFEFRNLFDTYVAARLLGRERVGLSALLQEVIEIEIPKDPRLQKHDWSRRPLSERAIDYAAADVRHLAPLRDALAASLHSLGRAQWAAEEFARLEEVRHVPMSLDDYLFSLKESRGLDDRGLAVLRALVEYRDAEARRLNRPPSYILSNAALGAIAVDSGAEAQHMASVPRRFADDVRKAVARGKGGPPLRRPAGEPSRRLSREETAAIRRRLRSLKEWRVKEADALAIDPALVWPMSSIERLARRPSALDEERESREVRHWQFALGAERLRELLASLDRG